MERKSSYFTARKKSSSIPCLARVKKHNDFGLGVLLHGKRGTGKGVGRFLFAGRFCKPLYAGYGISAGFTFEQPGLYHSQLGRRAGRAPPFFPLKTPVARRAKQYLIDNFSVNVNAYDLITGYRADDSYFDYAESFLNNAISVEQLSQAMRLGKLGEQVVIKSTV